MRPIHILAVLSLAALVACITPLTFTDYFNECKGSDQQCTQYALDACAEYGCAQ